MNRIATVDRDLWMSICDAMDQIDYQRNVKFTDEGFEVCSVSADMVNMFYLRVFGEKIETMVEDDLEIGINVGVMKNLSKKLEDDKIKISKDENESLVLEDEQTAYRLPVLSIDDEERVDKEEIKEIELTSHFRMRLDEFVDNVERMTVVEQPIYFDVDGQLDLSAGSEKMSAETSVLLMEESGAARAAFDDERIMDFVSILEQFAEDEDKLDFRMGSDKPLSGSIEKSGIEITTLIAPRITEDSKWN